MVKGMRFQNDLPKSTEISVGVRRMASAAMTTMMTASAAKT